MHKIIFTLILAFSFGIISSQPISETEKLYTTAKIWGFLKYYHPEVASGKRNWDKELFETIEKTASANDKKELSAIYLSWIESLGPVAICKKCDKPSKKNYLDKNFDLSWTQDLSLFSPEVAKKLKFIENNRYQGVSHYFGTHLGVGNVYFKNESEDKSASWQDKNYRILTLVRYWNQIEYFFPYKYLTDQKWDDVLKSLLPKFLNPESEQQFDLARLALITAIDDSHAGLFSTPETDDYFGLFWMPVTFKIIDDKAVVTGFYDKSKADLDDLKIGDAIESIDGKTIAQILEERKPYLTASNLAVKKRHFYAFLNGQSESAVIRFSRDGKSFEKTVKRYKTSGMSWKKPEAKPKWKVLENGIGYVNMGVLEIRDVSTMWEELKDMKAIVFDIRNYPQGTMFAVAKHLFPKQDFVKFTQPDPKYPGKFYWSETMSIGKNSKDQFKGKVILLVNETSQSHAEFTVMGLQKSPNAITIGSQTSGADGNVSDIIFPDGKKTNFTGIGVYYPDGGETQRVGIRVDVKIESTISGIAAGKDEVLDKALEIARSL